ncbi:MAG: putative nucleotidyltransferase component of viral defense system [Phenylobacterium sp.]|jgi:predicted nucleotidyltransferase component of viral defense system
MAPLDLALVEAIAIDLAVDESFVEKDWHAMQLAKVLQSIQSSSFQLVFSGGTSLSKGYHLIERFSEDLDFKVVQLNNTASRSDRSAYRKIMIETIRLHN